MYNYFRAFFNAKMCIIIFSLFFALTINNVLPYISLPTMGQALWAMGYAKSIGNGGFFNLYAHDIGIPEPAAIAFGLSAVIPISWLIKLGMLPEAAYSFVFAAWMALAFWGCYQLSRLFKLEPTVSALFSMLWLILPVVTRHSGYSMLMLGIALIPFYSWTAYNFLAAERTGKLSIPLSYLNFLVTVIISVFMDGYTFVMFAVIASAVLLFSFITSTNKVKFIVFKAVFFAVAFACAYFLYSKFIGKSNYQAEPLDFFRGWGVDLSFLIRPAKGVFWLSDTLGLSKHRLGSEYFGDASVWDTTFSLPFLLIGFWGWFKNKNKSIFIHCLFIVGVFSIYMSMGPSLKFHSFKPDNYSEINTLANDMLMPASYAIAPTGNALISTYLPGFNVMRASYRWIALGLFCFWALSICYVRNLKHWLRYLIVLCLITLYIPHLKKNWDYGRANFYSIGNINSSLVKDLNHDIPANSKVAFIPWNNDFFANYLAPFSGFKTFNIGGDKNLDNAKLYWPKIMVNLQGSLSVNQVPYITQLLLDEKVDYIVLPYVNMLWSAHYWLCPDETLLPLSYEKRLSLKNDLKFYCPDVQKNNLSDVVKTLKEIPFIDVINRDLYAILKVNNDKYRDYTTSGISSYPILINEDNYALSSILDNGWYYRESGHVWSKAESEIVLSVPAKNLKYFSLKFNVLHTPGRENVNVTFRTFVNGKQLQKDVIVDSAENVVVNIPIDFSSKSQRITMQVHNAKSPAELGIAPDNRILGISLQEISTE
ncbi:MULTISPECIES: hypothetical protein [unclassified Pantoea]|uniref:hypothetical protein n=1 Tax=unclassified Pantoea TaxID=2630326 RepID=UPI00301DB4F9